MELSVKGGEGSEMAMFHGKPTGESRKQWKGVSRLHVLWTLLDTSIPFLYIQSIFSLQLTPEQGLIKFMERGGSIWRDASGCGRVI